MTALSAQPVSTSLFNWRALCICLGLLALNWIVFGAVRHYEFVVWDDPQYVSANRQVLAGLTWPGVRWAFTAPYFYNWHPLTWLSHMVDVQIYGTYAGGHHLTSLLLHMANTILLFGLLYRMTAAMGRSGFVAALFAVHPLHVESVAWVAERKDVLSALFWMVTMWAYLRYVRRPRLGSYLPVVVVFALGLLAKPMLVTLPFTLLLMDVWPLQRLSLWPAAAGRSEPASAGDRRAVAARLVREKLFLFGLSLASSTVTFIVQQQGGAVSRLDQLPLSIRVANAAVSYATYIVKMLWPTRLAALYPYALSLPGWSVAGSILGLLAISVVVLWAARRRPYLAVGWLWYLGTLVPVIGLVQVGSQARADRYTYLPFIGLFLMVAWGIPELLVRWPHRDLALGIAASLVIGACTVSARTQVQYWQNSFALVSRALDVTTGNFHAHNYMGTFLEDQGKFDEALAHYREAVRLKPDYAEAHTNLGAVLAHEGRDAESVAEYNEALRLKPDDAIAHTNLGLLLQSQGREDDAIAHYQEALRLKPDFAEAHNNLGSALAHQGQLDEAIAHYTEALRLRPDFINAHFNLGLALQAQGKTGEAVAQYSEALRLDPNFAPAQRALNDLTNPKR
jgi:protein O-mannosyl-transferase